MTQKITPPKALKKPTLLEKHGHQRVDDYFWLNDRDNPEVIDYLNQEKNYYEQSTQHLKPFQDNLFLEMKSRIKEDDTSVPYRYNGYYYITRFEKGSNYPIYTRKKNLQDVDEEILCDGNVLATGHSYFHLVGLSVSDDNQWLCYGVDTVSRRQYTLHIKNIHTGEVLPDTILNTTGGATWAADNKTIFYSRKDELTLRPNCIYKHSIGHSAASDALVYEELDETFDVSVYRSKSKKYLLIQSDSTLTSEFQILKADQPHEDFTVFQKRTRGLEYSISHFEDSFYILTNKDGATNFKLMKTSEHATGKDFWTDVIPHRETVLLEDIDIFKDFLVVTERTNGLNQIQIIPWKGTSYYLPFESETYSVYTTTNIDFDTELLRYSYQSLTTPVTLYDFNMQTRTQTLLKQQEVVGGSFDKNNYVEKRIWAPGHDGVAIPISLVHQKEITLDHSNPTLLYAYGSYGATMDCYFSTVRLSLLDRGFIYAIAHVRGGEDLGRTWYENGKLMHKKNTFLDFISCSEYLIAQGYTHPNHLYAEGGSAGGMLMGTVINWRPELYHGVIAQVPFVDVVTTMLDESIPLTTGEYDEWGNPNEKDFYEYMLSYSPYDNVCPQTYPHLYVSTGLHDSQVQYWEPAKWVARLREVKLDNNSLYLDINMDTGHGGASGRFEALKEAAKEFSFLLDLEGIKS